MNEGTSIGEVENIENFSLDSNNENQLQDSDLKATKIGEISEFEREFINENEELATKETPVKKPESKKSDQDSNNTLLKSELEKFLEEETAQVFDYEDGDVIEGTVRSIEKSGILIDFNFKSDGYVSNSELGCNEDGKSEVLEPGQKALFFYW